LTGLSKDFLRSEESPFSKGGTRGIYKEMLRYNKDLRHRKFMEIFIIDKISPNPSLPKRGIILRACRRQDCRNIFRKAKRICT
jgi:hypothetical protein